MEFKTKQLNSKQKELLVNFVYARPDMYKGKLTSTYTNSCSTALWKEVSCILNAVPGGANKDWKQWRKAWTDITKNVKSRISKEKQYSQGTGGGPPLPPQEDIKKTLEEKICEIICPVAIQGNEDVPESQVIFEESSVLPETEQTEYIEIDVTDIQEVDTRLHEFEENVENPKIDFNCNTDTPKVSRTIKAKKENIQGMVKKRYTKSARLTDSITNSKKFLEISQKGIVSTDTYRKTKLELLEKHNEIKRNYYQKKIEAFESMEKYQEKKINVLTGILNAVNKISEQS